MYEVSKQIYDYLLPIYGLSANGNLCGKLHNRNNIYFFVGSYDEFKEAMNRCKYI